MLNLGFGHIIKRYVSEAQRNLFEMCRANPGQENCPPQNVVAEFHAKSKGHMKDKNLPARKKKSLMSI